LHSLAFLILVQIETSMEEKEKDDELSIKHKLSQPEGLSVHTHWKTTTLPQKMLSDSKPSSLLRVQSKVRAGLHVGSAQLVGSTLGDEENTLAREGQ
jgi:hypothetical protein